MRKIILFFLCIFSIISTVLAQVDSQYIEFIPRSKTIQVHTTLKDLNVQFNHGGETISLFRNHNWSTGMYLKKGLFELFFAIPMLAIDNSSIDANNTFGTGFGLNFYPNKIHVNYNFKLVLGYENFNDALDKGFDMLQQNNYFIFNRVNFHYILNSERWSLKSALRFHDKQLKSAGSVLIYAPISYHNMRVNNLEQANFPRTSLVNFHRLAIGGGLGYGYTHVLSDFNVSIIAKAGLDLRYNQWGNDHIDDHVGIYPNVNLIASIVYDVGEYFIGINYNYYPEFAYGQDYNLTVENWKMRLHTGKRFY